jgi:hypothetical protein
LPISNVQEFFDEKGTYEIHHSKAKVESFIEELVWYTEAMINQKQVSKALVK